MASFDSSAALATIATLEKELARLKGLLGVGDGKVPKPAKVKRERNPDAKPNPWIEFVKRLHSALKDVEYDGPATVVTLFGKAMKDEHADAYSMDEEALRAAFGTWLTPERLEHARSLKRGSKVAEGKAAEEKAPESGESAAETEGEEKRERKKRAPMTEEAKAAMAAKRAATKAAKAAEKAGDAAEPSAAAEKPKKAKATTYTVEQLTDWEELTWEGAEFGRNIRGDVIDGEGNFVGHWDGKTLDRSAPKPADWDTVMA